MNTQENGAPKCGICGKHFENGEARFNYGNSVVCQKCIDRMASIGNICPNCGSEITPDAEEVGLVMTPKGSTALEKASAAEVLVIVCPECKILFFDEFQYNIVKGLKRTRWKTANGKETGQSRGSSSSGILQN